MDTETRILHFDIDGCILNYEPEEVKPRLAAGKLQALLERKGFDQLNCVSGWTSLALESRYPSRALSDFDQKEVIRELVLDAFPDRDLFHALVTLSTNNDERGHHVNLDTDWYYVDDWAKEFFEAAHGRELFERYSNKRILMCDPNSDGADIVAWLEQIPDRV